ncbi:MAG: prenyltransferase [Anaerotardibacter sp.]
MKNTQTYAKFTPVIALQLIAPQTWIASIMPVLFSVVYCAITYSGTLNLLNAFILLIICNCMQSASNVLNDYLDFKKGTDTEQSTTDDKFEAALVYNPVNPKAVLALFFVLLAIALGLGIYLVTLTSLILLLIGILGAAVVVLYSWGKVPISYLPVGEIIIGGVMGLLMPLACCYVLSGVLDPGVLVAAFPIAWGIGMILATNNTCDIEKDIEANRNTLAVSLGRELAVKRYKQAIVVWMVLVAALVALFYTNGLPIIFLMIMALFPLLRAVKNNPFIQATRDPSMSQAVSLNIIIGAFYITALLFSGNVVWIF